ncbi:MAG TPA: hypothetical protein VM889_01730 [Candidatus Thermoplasmatota archaeon]|nr:hypothetical protein [Candidatus Thermoplasmatota archaeon]
MPKGLDIGTMNIVSAKPKDGQIDLTKQRNLFVEVEYSDIAEKMLSRSNVLYIKNGKKVYIVGEDALNFANIFNKETRRPMNAGILSRKEKDAIPMIRLIVERVVGAPHKKGEHVYFTCPAKPVDAPIDTLYHQKTLEAILHNMGYNAHAINEGMAVVYSELADSSFTGLGVSFGAGMTNACLSYYAVPVTQFSVARGGDWIDNSVAQATGTPVDRVTAAKERDFRLDASSHLGELQGALAVYYDNLLEYVVRGLERQTRDAKVQEDLEIPCVITGGTAAPKGFRQAFEAKLREADLPFRVKSVSEARHPLYSVARGALVAAQAEEGDHHHKDSKK